MRVYRRRGAYNRGSWSHNGLRRKANQVACGLTLGSDTAHPPTTRWSLEADSNTTARHRRFSRQSSGHCSVLNVLTRCGFKSCARQIRPTEEALTFISWAKLRVLQCVESEGVSWVVL